MKSYGLEKGKIEIAKQMLKNNIDIATIIDCTGLSQEEILKINSK